MMNLFNGDPVDPHDLVMEWHTKYNVPVGQYSVLLSPEREKLRMDLIKEEYKELLTAVAEYNFIETIDALADLIYVIYGMAIEMGVNLGPVLTEIQRSNMSKLGADGKPIFRDDGKVLKGPNYSPPNLRKVIYT
jgi:predicted HAD superfamily Cof-like phosphohydrolase